VNRLDQWVCRSGGWQKFLEGQLLPWVLKDVELRRDLLEIGPGPGLTTDLLRSRVERLTTIEIDPGFAEPLKQRMDGTNVTVVQGDAAKMPFESGSFSALVCFTMLHHVPSPALQDCLLQEACRVLKPGGIFVGHRQHLECSSLALPSRGHPGSRKPTHAPGTVGSRRLC